jgi:hypothetical protein
MPCVELAKQAEVDGRRLVFHCEKLRVLERDLANGAVLDRRTIALAPLGAACVLEPLDDEE